MILKLIRFLSFVLMAHPELAPAWGFPVKSLYQRRRDLVAFIVFRFSSDFTMISITFCDMAEVEDWGIRD